MSNRRTGWKLLHAMGITCVRCDCLRDNPNDIKCTRCRAYQRAKQQRLNRGLRIQYVFDRAAAMADYRAGMTAAHVAAAYGTTIKTIHRLIAQTGSTNIPGRRRLRSPLRRLAQQRGAPAWTTGNLGGCAQAIMDILTEEGPQAQSVLIDRVLYAPSTIQESLRTLRRLRFAWHVAGVWQRAEEGVDPPKMTPIRSHAWKWEKALAWLQAGPKTDDELVLLVGGTRKSVGRILHRLHQMDKIELAWWEGRTKRWKVKQ